MISRRNPKSAMVALFTLLSISTVMAAGKERAQMPSSASAETSVTLHFGEPQWEVSKYLTGTHFVYAFEEDWIYRDPVVTNWMKRARVGVIRYPGGTVTMNWHWDQLNGYAFEHHVKKLTGTLGPADTWDPHYKPLPARDPATYMDVDEYVALCTRVGADAMISLNIRSGAKYKRVEDGMDEARRLVAHCKSRGYDVPFWYIGNEGYAKGFWGQTYIKAIDDYGAIVKAAFPDAKIIADWKYGPREKQRFEQSLKIVAGAKLLDVMEYHEKWGNDWGIYSGKTRAEWLAQKPFLYNGQFSGFYERFETHNQAIGRNVKHAHNEWGIGGMHDSTGVFDFALLTADFFIELFRHRTYMACCWNLNAGPKFARVFVAEDGNVKLMPPALVYELVASAMGQRLVPVETRGNDAVYGFAVTDTAAQRTEVFLLNKGEQPATVSAAPDGSGFSAHSVHRLVAPGKIEIEELATPATTVQLQPMSFTRIIGTPPTHP